MIISAPLSYLAVVLALALARVDGFQGCPSFTRTNVRLNLKGNGRANMEKRLEDLMDNDWREFRARLVAREQSDSTFVNLTQEEVDNKDLQKQNDMAVMFADAISHIFPSKKNEKQLQSVAKQEGAQADSSESIFGGNQVGKPANPAIEDPFLSEAELPSFLPEIKIDKHRWAHTVPHIEPGCVLVANEKLGGVFHQTVVLIIDHSEKQGSTGVIINRPLPGTLREIAEMSNSTLDLSLKLAFSKSLVTYGGPVNVDQFSVLHAFGEVDGSRKLAKGIFVGGSLELMDEVRVGTFQPEKALFIKGHAAWVAGQLQREITKGVWYPASVSADFILRYAGAPIHEEDDTSDLWADIMHSLGQNHANIARQHAGRGDRRMMP